jgi:serine/threonine-protein kinase
MSPEQLAGGPATTQSDLFSLGLVLHELFSGRRAFPARNRDELSRLYKEHTPPPVSDLVHGLDPRIAKVIQRCLDKDPANRPVSALSVVADLPKRDPLATALAQGHLPSPEMVANAGAEGTISPSQAFTLLASVAVGLLLVALLAPRASLYGMVPLELPPRALDARARYVLDRLKCTDLPADSWSGFQYDYEYLNSAVAADATLQRWSRMAAGDGPAMAFWYRQSPQELAATAMGVRAYPGRVSPSDPPLTVPGMVTVMLDTKGQLIEFERVPERETADAGRPAKVDWQPLFEEARLNWSQAEPATPQYAPPFFADQRMAWLVPNPICEAEPLRVEAAADGGEIVYFKVFHGPWDRPAPHQTQPPESIRFQLLYAGLLCLYIAGAGWLARRNLKLGIGDRAGAFRLAAFQFVCYFACTVLVADHAASFTDEATLLMKAFGFAAVWSLICWLLYVAMEPYVRRRWPWRLVSWNRLLAGRFADPMVGRDVLIGVVLGLFLAIMHQAGVILPPYFGRPSPLPLLAWPSAFTNVPFHLLMEIPVAVRDALQSFILLFLLVLFVRNEWLAVAIVFLLVLSYSLLQEPELHFFWAVLMGAIVGSYLFVALRFGLLASAVGLFVCYFLYQVPLTLHFSCWYWWQSFAYIAWTVVFAVLGFVSARGGQSEFGG